MKREGIARLMISDAESGDLVDYISLRVRQPEGISVSVNRVEDTAVAPPSARPLLFAVESGMCTMASFEALRPGTAVIRASLEADPSIYGTASVTIDEAP